MSILKSLIFPIFSFNNLIFLILFSILMQSLINKFKLLLSQLFSIFFPFSIEIFILFDNLSKSFIIFSLKYNSLYLLSTSNNNSSSRLFSAFLILVNVFWISFFNSSLLLFILSYIGFNSFIFWFKLIDISSKHFIFSFNLFLFSFSISSIKHIYFIMSYLLLCSL